MVCSAAAQHEMGLARAPKTLPTAARNAVFKSLIKNNLLTEINAPREHVGLGWRQDDDGTWIVARITDEGLRAIGIDPNEDNAVDPPTRHNEAELLAIAPAGANVETRQAEPADRQVLDDVAHPEDPKGLPREGRGRVPGLGSNQPKPRAARPCPSRCRSWRRTRAR